MCCRPSNGRKMQALIAVEWLTAVRYETDGRLANGWTDGLPENRLTGLGAGLPLTIAAWLRNTVKQYNCARNDNACSFGFESSSPDALLLGISDGMVWYQAG